MLTAMPLGASPGSVRDFRLPSAERPSTEPQAQGPVDTEGPIRRAPRVIPGEDPVKEPAGNTAPSIQPVPESQAEPFQRPGAVPSVTTDSSPTERAPAQTRSATVPSAAPVISASPSIIEPRDDATRTVPVEKDRAALPSPTPAITPSTVSQSSQGFEFSLLWWLVLAALIAALAIAYAFRKRGRFSMAEPMIETVAPLRKTEPSEPAAAPEYFEPRVPIQITAEARSLSRSLMNATLAFSLDLRNLGTQPLRDLTVHADLVTAHGKAPLEDQLAGHDSDIAPVATVAHIAAQDTNRLDSELRLPVQQIRTMAQGKARIYVPLLRIRIAVESKEILVRTFVIGIRPLKGRGRLQPFRLDEMAQTYRNIELRALEQT